MKRKLDQLVGGGEEGAAVLPSLNASTHPSLTTSCTQPLTMSYLINCLESQTALEIDEWGAEMGGEEGGEKRN